MAHSFYHIFGNNFTNQIELSKDEIIHYLKGYEIDTEHKDAIVAVTHHGIPLGGGKVSKNKIKNYYPKNLRIN